MSDEKVITFYIEDRPWPNDHPYLFGALMSVGTAMTILLGQLFFKAMGW
jgi:hypothetical protein